MALSATDHATLVTELTTDPLTRGYAGMTNEQALADLLIQNRDAPLSSISGDLAFSVTDTTQFNALSDAKRDQWLSFCARDSIDPFGAANVAFVIYIFGAGSATVNALNALRNNANGQSRAQELGIGHVRLADIIAARA